MNKLESFLIRPKRPEAGVALGGAGLVGMALAGISFGVLPVAWPGFALAGLAAFTLSMLLLYTYHLLGMALMFLPLFYAISREFDVEFPLAAQVLSGLSVLCGLAGLVRAAYLSASRRTCSR